MPARPRLRSSLLAVAVGAATAVVGVGPASAGGTTTTHAATWRSTGSVEATLTGTSNTRVVDQTTYDDKINAVPTSPETVTVTIEGVRTTCAYGSAYASGLSVWGAGQWMHLPDSTRVGVRLQLACQAAGVLHRYNWGVERTRTGNYANATNCVVLTRVGRTITLSADAGCPVQDEVLDPKPSRQLSARNGLSVPFEATVTF